MRNFKIINVLICLFCSSVVFAAPLQDKFTTLMSKIEGELKTYAGNENNIEALSSGSLRQYLFTIQTLADMYHLRYASLSKVHSKTKQLEDNIGNFRKTIEQLAFAQQAGASAEKIASLTANKDKSRLRLIDYLKTDRWTDLQAGQVFQLLNIVNTIAWQSEASDKSYTFESLSSQVNVIDQTAWNMDVLEGTGIHDLRKSVRWYKLEMSALNDLMGTQSNSCKQGAIVPTNPVGGGKCLISSCLHERMIEIYDTFGEIKDAGEGADGLEQPIDQALLQKAKDLYIDTRQNEIFKYLAEEINSCK